MQYTDWLDVPEQEVTQRLNHLLTQELADGFEMSEPTLFRVKLIRLREQQFHVVLSCHHILLDAWCWSLILMDFFAYYRERTLGVPFDRPTPRPYRDFVMWLARQDRQAATGVLAREARGF